MQPLSLRRRNGNLALQAGCSRCNAETESTTAIRLKPDCRRNGPSPPCRGEGRFEIGRQRRLDVDRLTGHRVLEGEPGRVQELSLQPEVPGPTVQGIPGDRELDGRQMNADLVRSSGLERDAQQRVSRQELHELEMRQGLARRVGVERMTLRVVSVAPDRRLDRPAPRLRPADDEPAIFARELPPPDE